MRGSSKPFTGISLDVRSFLDADSDFRLQQQRCLIDLRHVVFLKFLRLLVLVVVFVGV